jgi:peptidoglycan hydrolase CwlO-like protein
MDNEKLYEFIQSGFTKLENGISNLEKGQTEMRKDISKIDIKLEELDKKVQYSLEGHANNTEQLNRIENELAKDLKFIPIRAK